MNADAPFSPTPGRPVPRDDGSHWVLVADEGVAHLLRLPEAAEAQPVMNMLMAKNEAAGRRAWMEENGALVGAEI